MRITDLAGEAKNISIDTRTMRKGHVFIALKGERYDGHDFVEEALGKGARLAVVSRMPKIQGGLVGRLLKVDDTLKALGDIAKAHRAKFKIPVVAITGSNGKTTAKDMAAWVLGSRYKVLKNKKSFNNFVGLPLSLLELDGRHGAAVLEMGTNRSGEIRRLADIAKPDVGVITNIGPTHLEFLKSVENIFREKAELLKALSADGVAILNKDDSFLGSIKRLKAGRIYFGIEKKCDFKAENVYCEKNKWHFSVKNEKGFRLPLLGRHNIYNALSAIAIGRNFGISFGAIKRKINNYTQNLPMRLEFKEIRGVHILDDSYNSNPGSMACALDSIAAYATRGKKIIVAGDMLELGKLSRGMHELMGEKVAAARADALITMGKLSKFLSRTAKRKGVKSAYHADSQEEAASLLRKITRPGDVVLVKGSRGMAMEKVIESFKNLSEER